MLPEVLKERGLYSQYPPSIINTQSGHYTMDDELGWVKVLPDTKLEELFKVWKNEKKKSKNTVKNFKIKSFSSHKEYIVKSNLADFYDCPCVGFPIRRNCSHVEQLKVNHGILKINDTTFLKNKKQIKQVQEQSRRLLDSI